MDDHDLDSRLSAYGRSAPRPFPPDQLLDAIERDREEVTRRFRLSFPGPYAHPVVAGALAIVIVAVVAASAVLVASRGSSNPPVAAPAAPVTSINWQPGTSVASGPVYALNGKLWSFWQGVRSSSDGTNWEVMAPASTFVDASGTTSVFTAAAEDGHGGLIAFAMGAIGTDGSGPVPPDGSRNTVWHSADGRTWTHAAFPGFVHGIARLGDTFVATSGGGMYERGPSMDTVWYSTDGQTWARGDTSAAVTPGLLDTPGTNVLDRIMTYSPIVWSGRFYAVGLPTRDATSDGECLSGCDYAYTVWAISTRTPRVLTSADGRTWTPAFTASNPGLIVTEAPRLQIVGDALVLEAMGQPEPRAWYTSDGTVWTPAQPAANPTAAIQGPYWSAHVTIGGSAVVMVSAVPSEGEGDGVTSVWTTTNGASWTLLDNAPWKGAAATAVTFDGRIYVTTVTGAVWVGTPATAN